MKIFGFELRRASPKEINNVVSTYAGGYHRAGGLFGCRHDTPLLLSAVYRCVEVISDSVAQLPLEIYSVDADGYNRINRRHPCFYLLRDEPNRDMTRFTFFKVLIASMLLRGNAYAYISRRADGTAEELVYLPADGVGVEWINGRDGVPRKRYRVTGFTELVEPKDMIHLLNFSHNGITGISTLEHARGAIEIAQANEDYANGFFQSGTAGSGVLSIIGRRLSDEQKGRIYSDWGRLRAGGLIVLEGDQKYTPLSISPKDAQMLESRQYGVVDICRFFGVSPVKAFDLSKSSYSTVEATQLAFLTDTLSPILEKIELEFTRKIFPATERGRVEARFNTESLLRTNKASQAAYYGTMCQNGIMTRNEIRRTMGLDAVDGGDAALVQVNMQRLSDATAAAAAKPDDTDGGGDAAA